MNLLRSLSIGRRLIAGFAAVMLLFLAVTATSFYSGTRTQEADRWNVHTYQVLGTSEDMLQSMINMETGARGYLLSGDAAFLAPWTRGIAGFEKAISQARTLTADNAQQQRRLDDMLAAHRDFRTIVEDLQHTRAEVSAGRQTLQALSTQFAQGRDKAAMDRFRALQAEFDGAESRLLEQRSAQSQELLRTTQWLQLGGSALALAIGMAMAVVLTRSITQPVQTAVEAAEAVAAGDLTHHMDTEGTDETARLLGAMQEMQQRLGGVVREIQQSAHSVATAASQLAQGSEDLSGRTEQQASTLEQTAASMEELGATVQQNAESARIGNSLAQDASEVARRGGSVVAQVVQTMGDINQSSRRIADITGVIDGIAFQTNILALNAAVEAARAGEEGRGFAVVAGEVRSLAQRSAEAAREIKSLITASVERVEQGSTLANEAGTTMGEVVAAIERVTHIMGEISSASSEQNTGVSQIGAAVADLDHSTQQNAALVEESSAAAESLKTQARALSEAVNVFRLAPA